MATTMVRKTTKAPKIRPLARRPAWKALQNHFKAIRDTHLRTLVRTGSAARPAHDRRGRRPVSRLLQEPSHRRDAVPAAPTGRGIGPGAAHPGHVQRREDQHHRKPRRAARGAARAQRPDHPGRWQERRAGSARGARQDDRLRQPRAQRRVERPHRQAHSQRGQHRHRRLRPRSGDGLRGAQALQRPRHDLPVCLQRRRHRFRRSGAAISIPRRRCSSSPPRPSPRSKP